MSDQTPQILTMDLGSSSVRALVLDATLKPVADARRPIAIWQDATGAAMIDGEAYVESATACVDELHEAGELAGATTAVMSSQWHSLLPLDSGRRAIGPGISWMDRRATAPTGLAPSDPEEYHQRTGAWWHTLYWPMRIAWLRANGIQAAYWCGLAEYMALRLLGEPAASVSSASGTGALDTRTCHWDREALELAGITEDAVPPVAPDDWRGRLVGEYAKRWPDLAEAEWALPVGDGAASALGSGCSAPDRLSVTVGTSAAARLVRLDNVVVPDRVWRYRVDQRRSLVGIAFSGGGVLYNWLTHILADMPSEEALSALVPGEHGLVSLPYHAGHRPPLDPDATGTLHGLRLSTGATEVVAATLEGTCHELADGARLLDPSGVATPVLGGGAVAASPWFKRRLAAAFGGRALCSREREVAAIGAAVMATGMKSQTPKEIEVSAEEVAAMADAGKRHRRLRELLSW